MKIYMDLSCFGRTNYSPGIQRVVCELLKRLLKQDGLPIVPLRYEEPVHAFYALDSKAVLKWVEADEGRLEESATLGRIKIDDFAPGDLFFDLDAAWVMTWRRSDLYPRLKDAGVKIVSYVYDIIPFTNPEVLSVGFVTNFLFYLGAVLEYADIILAPTQSTLDEIAALQDRLGLRRTRGKATWLGADFCEAKGNGSPTTPCPAAVNATSGRYVLMVDTLQPLKNHAVVLDAFDKGLFARGLNLVLAGKVGWKVEPLERRIREHPLFGRQLFLLEGMDDATIGYLYDHAFCVAFATLREGFGLPTIESFRHGTPVIASDIPVLREVGGEYCRYFDPHSPNSFVEAVSPLIDSEEEYNALRKKVSSYRPTTWAEVADRIAGVLRDASSFAGAKRILYRLGRIFGNSTRRAATVSFDDGAPSFADVNLGSPIHFYHPCHSGLSVDMQGSVWTEGNEAVIRVKARGAFRRALCLTMDFDTFNGKQSATLYVNDVHVGDFVACGRSCRVFSIPVSAIGEKRELAIRLELPDASRPGEVIQSGDTRPLALHLFDMRLFDEDGYFACHRGEDLYFGEDDGAVAVQYCVEGASHPEKKFTWTNGDKLVMRLLPFNLDDPPRSFTMHYTTLLKKEHVIALVNGKEVADYIAGGEERKTIAIPAECASEDGSVTITLLLPDAVSPRELNKGQDGRKLALRLFSLRVD
jgi:glycosyltransferase involved in cell wall biosynthesis